MKKDTTALKVFQSIINQAKANLEELCNFWNIYEKQLFFVSAIAIYDRYFIEQLPQKDKRSFNDRITEYSYPVFIRQFYDVVVIDKKTGEIALFQLKWQDPADYSPFTLKSKRSNYYSAAEKWLEIIEKWLSNSADEDIASKLGVKVKYFDKKKISIFVLGRRRGNYSGNGPYPYECAWSQWYQIMYAASYLRQENEFTISNLYKLIVSTSPFNIKISEKPVTFCYGKYRIKFGGKTFCGKDTR